MRSYLDHASTSPLREVAATAIAETLSEPLGDPSRSHAEGLRARHIVEIAREQVAEFFAARPREVLFCSGATEAISTAVFGTAGRGTKSVLSAVEHSAVRDSVVALDGDHTVETVGVDSSGRVSADEFIQRLDSSVGLAHLQLANHEVGTIQPLGEVFEAAAAKGVLLHCDAAMAAGHMKLRFRETADLMSVSSHKMGGPTGVGALMVRRGLRINPMVRGGDQERARRGGIENISAIAGFGAVCNLLASHMAAESAEALRLTRRVGDFASSVDGVSVLGDLDRRVPHLICLAIEGVEPQAVLLGLDAAGVAVHSGNSCSSESLEPSPVLAAMGVDAHRSLRVSVGPQTTDSDIDTFLAVLPRIVAELRALR